jgi:hypothetical protein
MDGTLALLSGVLHCLMLSINGTGNIYFFMNATVFWFFMPYNLLDYYQSFGEMTPSSTI